MHKQFRRLPLRGLGRHAQLHARLLLQNAHDAEKILRAWIAVRGEHAVKALARLVDLCGEAFKANGGIYQVAQNRLACTGVAGQISVDRFRKECLAEPRVVLRAFQNCAPTISCQDHFNISEQ